MLFVEFVTVWFVYLLLDPNNLVDSNLYPELFVEELVLFYVLLSVELAQVETFVHIFAGNGTIQGVSINFTCSPIKLITTTIIGLESDA